MDADGRARLREEQIACIRRNTRIMMIANACNALALVAVFWNTAQLNMVILWAAAVLAVSGTIYFRRGRDVSEAARQALAPNVMLKAVRNAFALGACWAAPPLMLFDAANGAGQLLIACLSSGMLCGGAFALASLPAAAIAMTLPIALASIVALLVIGDRDHAIIAAVLGIYFFALISRVVAHASQLRAHICTQIKTELQARTDPLTSLPNRLWFQDTVKQELARMRRSGIGFALATVDLDNFKLINDKYGYAAGDDLLRQVAQRMRDCVCSSDLLARIGGDEFAVLLFESGTKDGATLVAQRLLSSFEHPFEIKGQTIDVAACLGVAIAPEAGGESRTLLRNADIALYQAKRHGGAVCLFEPRHDTLDREVRSLEADLRRALQLCQFTLVFQPILDIGSNEIVGCEALLRWLHPTRGCVAPSVFIPLAEKTGLIHEIGLWVFEMSFKAAAQLPLRLRIAINVSPVQLRIPGFFDRVMDLASAHKIPSDRFEIEVTESALLADDENSDKAIHYFSQAGVGISLDDFGTGYSSLAHLRRLPLSKIKIDRIFTKDLLQQPDCGAIVSGLIRIASDLHKTIVAEGVEDAGQLDWLRATGCSEAQGYLIGAPKPLEEFQQLIEMWPSKRQAA